MAELVRIEPSLFRADEVWLVFDDGRKCLRRIDREVNRARSNFPAPSIRRDSIEPCMGGDRRMHDSLSSYRRSLRPDGNPFGDSFVEIGNETAKQETPQFDRKQRRDDIRAAIEDVKNGRVPPPEHKP